MAKLIFNYGAMGSGKTIEALKTRFNYLERQMNPALLKPMKENRDGVKIIRSRIGLEAECMFVEEFYREYCCDETYVNQFHAIIIDEAQFLEPKLIDFFALIADKHDIPVICYGLRSDFQSKSFPGSLRLWELADELNEIPTVCWCGCKARFNARVYNGHIEREGEQVMMGGNESYISLCRKHFLSGQIKFEE